MSVPFDNRPGPQAPVTASGSSAIAAGRDITQAQSGAGSFALHIEKADLVFPEACPSAESVDCPPVLTSLPTRAALFVGRNDELDVLNGASVTAGQAPAHVLHGLGGIGKSTLAARWAAEYSKSHAPVWWITANSRAAIEDGLAGLATALQPSLRKLLLPEQLGEWGRQWLATHTGWLLVLDNVLNPADVEPLLSRANTGRFLITSRLSTGWQGIAETVPLDVLSREDAVDLFTRIRGEDPDAGELCEELGHLPLAVAQAAAYCHEADCHAREYLGDLAAHPASMYAETEEGGDHERTIARIWHVTLDRLAQEPLTVRVLLILAWYASEGIPRTLLAPLGDPPTVRRALRRLAAHSMITLSGDTVTVHRLVQAVSRVEDNSDRHRMPEMIADARTTAMSTLARALPADDSEGPSTWPVMRALLPHVEALAGSAPPETDTPEMARLLTRTGGYMLGANPRLASRAMALLQRAEADCVHMYGHESPETIYVRVQLASATRMLFDVEKARPVAEQALADCLRILGTDHEVTISAQMNALKMANLSGDGGKALQLAEEALAGCVRVLGDDAPRTFEARTAVAMAVAETGDLARAKDMFDALLADCVRVLGEEHPETLSVRNVVTAFVRHAVIPTGPMDAMSKVVAAAENGTDLVTALREVVEQVRRMEPVEMARATEEEVAAAERHLETCLRVLDDGHIDTLAARMALLQTYAATGDERYTERAVRLLTETFTALGEDHPMTGMVLGVFQALLTLAEETPKGTGLVRTKDPD
ncbi:FxSxx-COOH system tetratricopeptide repeat protein [Streptomyces sp. NPDC057239]|uniref:FxSxx-COOH system tetratricopeptide repeat protein n=1 Tax=Streptomyces sp. NPDC057239 TaxID=3346061 RepID=UPI0036410DAE